MSATLESELQEAITLAGDLLGKFASLSIKGHLEWLWRSVDEFSDDPLSPEVQSVISRARKITSNRGPMLDLSFADLATLTGAAMPIADKIRGFTMPQPPHPSAPPGPSRPPAH